MRGFLIHDPLEHYAQLTPDHAALSCQGTETSYSDLHSASNRLAHAMIHSGAKPQDRIGIFLHKGHELGVAIYAILKTGGTFVPLDPFMPAERLAFIIEDCGINILISSDALLKTINQLPQDTRCDRTDRVCNH